MANLSEPAGWMALLDSGPLSGAAPGWIAALAEADKGPDAGLRGFSAASPFAPVPQPQSGADPAKQDDPVPDPVQAAFERGCAEGRAAAQAGAEAMLREQAGQIRQLRLAFRALDQAAMQALSADLRQTVIALCGSVLRDYAVDEAALLARCEAAAARLGGTTDALTLALNPETLAALDPAALAGWQVIPDPALAPGTLRLTGADGAVRDGPEDWLRAIREALGEGQGAG